MKFTPKNENELLEAFLYKAGEYDFEVLSAEDTISKKSGKEQLKVTIGIIEEGEITGRITDYLSEAMQFKVLHFCDAVGLTEEYNRGELTAFQCVNKVGRCKVGVRKDPTGQYKPQNTIADYIKTEKIAQPVAPKTGTPTVDEVEAAQDKMPWEA